MTGAYDLLDTAARYNSPLTASRFSEVETVVDVAVGQTLGKAVSKAIGGATKKTADFKVLQRQARTKQRVANNAKSRQAAKQRNANKAQNAATSHLARRATSASASASQVGSTVVIEVVKEAKDEENKK